jgi:membrane protein
MDGITEKAPKNLWLTKLWRFIKLHWLALVKFYDDDGFFLSSGIAFTILLNMIPLILLLTSFAGMYLSSYLDIISRIQIYLSDVAPALDPNITDNLIAIIQARNISGIVGFSALILFSVWIFRSFRIALSIVFKMEKRRGIIRGFAIDIMMLLIAEVLLLANMGLSSYIAVLENLEGKLFLPIAPAIRWILQYFLPFVIAFCMFFLVYKITPPRKIRFRSAIRAALFAALLWEVAKHVFEWYALNMAEYSTIYGPLSTAIVFIVWIYYSSAIFVIGGEYVYFLENEIPLTR